MGVCKECNAYVPDLKAFCGNCGATHKPEVVDTYTKAAPTAGNDGICTACGKAVSPTLRVFGSNDNLFHLACFECSKCARPVYATTKDSINPGGFEMRQGHVWCRKCVTYANKEEATKKVDIRWDAAVARSECAQCARPLGEGSTTRPSGIKWCAACSAEEIFNMPAATYVPPKAVVRPRCGGCGKDVYTDLAFKTVGSEVFHVSCAPMQEPCGGCSQPVSGRVVLAPDGKRWHEACFVCTKCGGSMLGGHGVVNGKLQCVTCVQAPPSGGAAYSSASSSSASALTGKKFCLQCGSKLEGRKFCTGCGTPVA